MNLPILFLVMTFGVMHGICIDLENMETPSAKMSDPNTTLTDYSKDMYVIQATVYQVGILTNITDNMTDNFNSTGNQESVTFYRTNGTNMDLSKIPDPFLTNVTAQTLVGFAPVSDKGENNLGNDLALRSFLYPAESTDEIKERTKKSVDYDMIQRLFKREATDGSLNPTVKVVNGAALIPPEAGIQSISLPALLSFNNNLTQIPVPIPNTSVVHYAKINTLIQKPENRGFYWT